MFYEERQHDGVWFYRTSPDGAWRLGRVMQQPAMPYPVTCEERFYDAASELLEDEPGLFSHDNANELGKVIEQWIETKRDNWEPRE